MTFLDAYHHWRSLQAAFRFETFTTTRDEEEEGSGRGREGNNYKVICNSIISLSFHSVYLLAKTRCWPKTVCQLQIAKFFFLCLRFKVNVAFASHEVGSKMKRVEGEETKREGGGKMREGELRFPLAPRLVQQLNIKVISCLHKLLRYLNSDAKATATATTVAAI